MVVILWETHVLYVKGYISVMSRPVTWEHHFQSSCLPVGVWTRSTNWPSWSSRQLLPRPMHPLLHSQRSPSRFASPTRTHTYIYIYIYAQQREEELSSQLSRDCCRWSCDCCWWSCDCCWWSCDWCPWRVMLRVSFPLQLGVMVFKRSVQSRKKIKSVLRPRVRPPIKDLIQVSLVTSKYSFYFCSAQFPSEFALFISFRG